MSRLAAVMAVLLLSGAVASSSYGDVRIDFRNGSSVVADECREEGSNLVCYRMGGSFEIDKREIRSTRDVPPGTKGSIEAREPDAPAGEKTGQEKKTGENGGGTPSKADGKEAVKRADPGVEEMKAFQAESERLTKEKQRLERDIQNAPLNMPPAQFNELNRRNAEMDVKIKQFNEKARQLMEKEKGPAPKE